MTEKLRAFYFNRSVKHAEGYQTFVVNAVSLEDAQRRLDAGEADISDSEVDATDLYEPEFSHEDATPWVAPECISPQVRISVDDRLPETGEEVAVLCKPRRKNMRPPRSIVVFEKPCPGEPREWWSLETSNAVDVTHWMLLPAVPTPKSQTIKQSGLK